MEPFNENVMYLQNEDFDENGKLLPHHDKPVVVMLMASWCGYCKKAKPEFQRFADKSKGRVYCAVVQSDGETDSEKELGKRMGKFIPNFRGFPTFVLFKDGKYVKTHEGGRNAEDFEKLL